jgi:hypothetical protein
MNGMMLMLMKCRCKFWKPNTWGVIATVDEQLLEPYVADDWV